MPPPPAHTRAASPRPAADSRVIVENVQPEIDAGRYPIKRTVGERVEVTADVYTDGHDLLVAVLKHRAETAKAWELASGPEREAGRAVDPIAPAAVSSPRDSSVR